MLLTVIEILPPSALFWAISKKAGWWMGGWVGEWVDSGYLIPVTTKDPLRANKLQHQLLWQLFQNFERKQLEIPNQLYGESELR